MKKGAIIKLIIFAGVAIYAALCAFFFPLGLMLLPAVLAYAAVACGIVSFVIAVLLSAAGIFAVYSFDWTSLSSSLLLYLPAAILLAYLLLHKRPYRTAVGLCSAALTLGLYSLICLPSLLAGNGPFAAVTEFIEQFGAAILDTAVTMELDAQAMELLKKLVAAMPYAAADTAMLSMLSLGMATGFANVLISRALLVRSGLNPRPMARFYCWQLSPNFMQGSFILLLGALIVQFTDIENATAIVTAIECIVGAPFALMGVCMMAFAYRIKAKTRTFLTISAIALLLMLPYSIIGLCIIGAADRLLGMRRAYLARNKDNNKH